MKKIHYTFLSLVFVIFSCTKKSKIYNDFDCNSTSFSNLETIYDVKNLFSVEFPENWKTKLYFDDGQSSIFGADTTKQLTQTSLLDVSFIQKSINFDDNFKLNLEREKLSEQLIRIKSKNQHFNTKEAYYAVSVGKKNNFNYKILDYFIKVDNQNFTHIKVQIYGDSLVNQRLCKTIELIDKIKFQ